MIQRFLEFEEKYGLLDKEINGFRYWNYSRFNIYKKLVEISSTDITEVKAIQTKVGCFEIFSIIKNCLWNNPIFKVKKKDILIVNHPRKIKNGDYFECIYTEELSKFLGTSAYSVEFLNGLKHSTPVNNPNLIYLDYIDIFGGIAIKVTKFMNRKVCMFLNEEANKIDKVILDEFGVSTGEDYIRSLFVKRYLYYFFKKKLVKKLIKKINPKIIVEVVGYLTNNMIINEVANELGIETIELQHGVMGRGHLAYNYLNKREYNYFPNKIFLFSDYWREVTQFPIEDKNLIEIGFPYLEKNLHNYANYKDNNLHGLNIVIISQPEFSMKISSLVSSLANKLENSNVDYHIIYKLHPAEYGKKNEYIKDMEKYKNVEIVADATNSIYYYFSRCNIQIGVTSTAIFEGLAFKLNTFIYHLEKTDSYMGDLCKMGIARMFDDLDTLVEMLLKVDTESNFTSNKYFWKTEAFNNLIKEINCTLKKG
ncbi:hypothetical protein [Clostridium sp.]|uniref:hypothetical protein n=1 Tax=Clostridium sp. TaxID=1506 RepID=UPI003216FA26